MKNGRFDGHFVYNITSTAPNENYFSGLSWNPVNMLRVWLCS